MAFRPSDSKREEFRKYLEKAGLLDALTKALVNLYGENDKPTDAIHYLKSHLNSLTEPSDLSKEVEELNKEISSLRLENEQLKETITKQAQLETEVSQENKI